MLGYNTLTHLRYPYDPEAAGVRSQYVQSQVTTSTVRCFVRSVLQHPRYSTKSPSLIAGRFLCHLATEGSLFVLVCMYVSVLHLGTYIGYLRYPVVSATEENRTTPH
ncbi:hypothetical protein N656DRAFT_32896 [Canariomyces notabilis]|uniref:Uncharacterized protein n=1 Tax=Canariomyces notabilis TaxID=2074819 RepID=A0AAN6YX61_9PEZI|nr:hypothetical protein N656DRAFT_32896 [Canariomyces arenarius]